MAQDSQRVLSVAEAASIIYDASNPSEEQLGKIRIKLQKGSLKRSAKGGWTTTPQAVADYMAARAKQRQQALHASRTTRASDGHSHPTAAQPSKRPRSAPGSGADASSFSSFYRDVLRDYFLALALRRRVANRSQTFQRTVVAGQIVVLLSLLLVVGWGYRQIFVPTAPERIAVMQWLDQNTKEYQIVEWFPAELVDDEYGSQRQRVRYKYFSSSRKGIVTDRQFLIRNGQVTEFSQVE